MNNAPPSREQPTPFWRSKLGIVVGMLLVIVLFYFAREHYTHIPQLLPYAILLLCPLTKKADLCTVINTYPQSSRAMSRQPKRKTRFVAWRSV